MTADYPTKLEADEIGYLVSTVAEIKGQTR